MNPIKRQTLKRISGIAIAGTGFGMSANSVALQHSSASTNQTSLLESDIQVHTRLSAQTNDLEVVITNISDSSTTITHMTPSHATRRGVFDFSALLDKGELSLKPGESVSVPLIPHTVSLGTSNTSFSPDKSLAAALRSSLKIEADNAPVAGIIVLDGIKMA